ncbi:MAG TPA: hypothetical protein PLG20_02010 [Candidatus Syntrophosphaera sp.]|nr:hypothetical protein [Candidatus Syntrophosphaera sp.]
MRKYTLRNLRFPARADFNLEDEAAAKLCVPRTAFRMESILRQAVDTRKANHPVYDFTLELAFSTSPPRHPDLSETPAQPQFPVSPIAVSDPHPFIIGMGPAGLFCALAMAENGLQPWLFDRGDPLELRSAKVSEFWLDGVLDPDSNVQFGEGGAGAFSDGKLTSRGKDPSLNRILEELVRFGAPAEIAWQALPHLGTDGIRAVVKKLREYLIAKGCRFHYRSALEDLDLEQGKVRRARISGQWHKPEMIILALGNAARGAFRMLHERGVALEPKPFALGLRIEQKQSHINRLVYGSEKWAELLGPATYRLTASTGFTFCMCPGGHVIAAASEAGGVVTNGMSFAGRRNAFCNSAVVTSVGESDYGSGLWDGIDLQRRIERAACKSGYLAPAQTASGFLREKLDGGKPAASYLPDVYAADLNALFTSDIAQRLKSALQRFDEILRGFTNEAVLIAPETRTSSPLRIPRHNKDLHSLSARNLFPIGEGSGYAGGIVSSAADGWRLGSRFRLG